MEHQQLIEKLLWIYGVKVCAPMYENDSHKVIIPIKSLQEFIDWEIMDNMAAAPWYNANKAAESILSSFVSNSSLAFDKETTSLLRKTIIENLT